METGLIVLLVIIAAVVVYVIGIYNLLGDPNKTVLKGLANFYVMAETKQ